MTWRVVSKRSVRNLQFGLLLVSTIWGLDYLLPPTENGNVLTFFEAKSYLPIHTWGQIMVSAGIMGLVCEGFLARNEYRYRKLWVGSWIAHTLFGGIFIALSLGSFLATVINNEGWYGFRTPALWCFIALAHWSFARRLERPVPPVKFDISESVETSDA